MKPWKIHLLARTKRAAAATLCLFLCAARTASAQPPASGVQTPFQKGQQALAQGSLELATRELEQACAQDAERECMRLLGDIALRQGRGIAAADLYRRYLAKSAPTSPSTELLQRVSSAEQNAAEVAVDGLEGALLRVDGRLVGKLPLATPLLLSEGKHELLLQHRDRQQVYRLKASVGAPLRVLFPRSATDVVVQDPATVVLVLNRDLSADGNALAQCMRLALRRGGQWYAVSEERTTRELERAPKGCLADLGCRRDLARRLHARYVVEANRAAPTAPVTVEVLDVEVGQLAGQSTADCKDCESCNRGDAPLTQAVDASMGQALSQPHGQLRISSRPNRAEIYLDGKALNLQTPQSLTVFAGQHQLKLSAPEHLQQLASVSVDAGGIQLLELTLPVNPAAVQRRRLALGKWVMLSASVLALGGGIAAIVVNRTYREDPDTPKLLSWPYGVASLTLGGLLMAGTSVLWWNERAAARRARAAE